MAVGHPPLSRPVRFLVPHLFVELPFRSVLYGGAVQDVGNMRERHFEIQHGLIEAKRLSPPSQPEGIDLFRTLLADRSELLDRQATLPFDASGGEYCSAMTGLGIAHRSLERCAISGTANVEDGRHQDEIHRHSSWCWRRLDMAAHG